MSDCVHHWIVDTPNGPKVKQKCKKCGLEKIVPSAIDYFEDYKKRYGRQPNITINKQKAIEAGRIVDRMGSAPVQPVPKVS